MVKISVRTATHYVYDYIMNGLVNLFLKDFKAGFQIKYIHTIILMISYEVEIYPNHMTPL